MSGYWLWRYSRRYSISQEICTRFCCALLCCGYGIVQNEFTWSIYPYSSGLLFWYWAIVRLPQCQWSKPDGYGKISQCITTTKHSKAKTVCTFLGIYCMRLWLLVAYKWIETGLVDFVMPMGPVLCLGGAPGDTNTDSPKGPRTDNLFLVSYS